MADKSDFLYIKTKLSIVFMISRLEWVADKSDFLYVKTKLSIVFMIRVISCMLKQSFQSFHDKQTGMGHKWQIRVISCMLKQSFQSFSWPLMSERLVGNHLKMKFFVLETGIFVDYLISIGTSCVSNDQLVFSKLVNTSLH